MRGKWVWWRMLDSCKLEWGNGYGWIELTSSFPALCDSAWAYSQCCLQLPGITFLSKSSFASSLTFFFPPLFFPAAGAIFLGKPLPPFLLFITSASWPSNHPPSAARLMQTTSYSQLGVPYPLSKCNPKPRKKPLPRGPLHQRGSTLGF